MLISTACASQNAILPLMRVAGYGFFVHLSLIATTLHLRGVRALEHWQGNTHLTLAAIIVRTVKENMHRPGNTRT